MRMSFQTADRKHWLRAYQSGVVAADAEAIGELDEVFEVQFPWNDERASLQIHGKYVRAHPEPEGYKLSALSAEVNAEEIFTFERHDGKLNIRTSHGLYVCAEGGGGGEVVGNREKAFSWETFIPSSDEVILDVTPLPRPYLEDNKRWLGTANGRVDYRSKSAFTLLGRIMAGGAAYVRDYLIWAKAERFTEVRVFICNTIGGYKSGPDMPGFWPACDALVTLCAEQGLYLRACMIAATEPFGGVWQGHNVDIWKGSVRAKGEAFAIEFGERYKDSTNVIYELFNEPCNIGLKYSEDAVIQLGEKVKKVAPSTLLMGGHYENTRMCSKPFDIVTIHYYRAMEVRGCNWIKRSSEYAPTQKKNQAVPMAAMSGEPANAGQWRKDGHNGDVYRDVSTSFAAGAMSRAHQYLPNFHSDDGLYTDLPEQITLEHIRAWHNALDAFPMRTGNPWTGHHGQQAGDYWRNVWPPYDDTAKVEQWIREGKGPWRAYGTDEYSTCYPEPQGWDYKANAERGVERLATSIVGEFAASVYRWL